MKLLNTVVSLFSGCGGLDIGFKNAGFKISYANEFDKTIWETYEKNHNTQLDKRNIIEILPDQIPDSDGIIGGPPCQSWSTAGAKRGIEDERGQVLYEYIRILRNKQPLFFLIENVSGLLSKTHFIEFQRILEALKESGYNLSYKQLNARDYGVPQDRERVFIVGYHKKIGKRFTFPIPTHVNEKVPQGLLSDVQLPNWVTIREAIGDLPEAIPSIDKNKANDSLKIPNHEYFIGGFSSLYLARNRRRDWNEQSRTIMTSGRHANLHPSSEKLRKVNPDEWEFQTETSFFRRFTVRESARLQTFPDSFIFYYTNIDDGYKMVGNAVPVKLAEILAKTIKEDLKLLIIKLGGESKENGNKT